jgi:hypothetical protein
MFLCASVDHLRFSDLEGCVRAVGLGKAYVGFYGLPRNPVGVA